MLTWSAVEVDRSPVAVEGGGVWGEATAGDEGAELLEGRGEARAGPQPHPRPDQPLHPAEYPLAVSRQSDGTWDGRCVPLCGRLSSVRRWVVMVLDPTLKFSQ